MYVFSFSLFLFHPLFNFVSSAVDNFFGLAAWLLVTISALWHRKWRNSLQESRYWQIGRRASFHNLRRRNHYRHYHHHYHYNYVVIIIVILSRFALSPLTCPLIIIVKIQWERLKIVIMQKTKQSRIWKS